MPSVRYWEVVVARKRCSTVSRTNLPISRNLRGKARLWGYRGKIQIGAFGQGILRPEGCFFVDRGEDV